jgi:hypothetical protein
MQIVATHLCFFDVVVGGGDWGIVLRHAVDGGLLQEQVRRWTSRYR